MPLLHRGTQGNIEFHGGSPEDDSWTLVVSSPELENYMQPLLLRRIQYLASASRIQFTPLGEPKVEG